MQTLLSVIVLENLYPDLGKNIEKFNADFTDCSDFLLREAETNNQKCIFIAMDGLVNSIQLGETIMDPILHMDIMDLTPFEQFSKIKTSVVQAVEMNEIENFEDAYYYLMSGFCLFIIDGCNKALAMGVQGWLKRTTEEPSNESNLKGAKECFVETLNDNKALLRKRVKTHHLKFKMIKLGTAAQTSVTLAYIDDRADKKLVREVENRLKEAELNNVLDYGMIYPFINTDIYSFFSTVGTTERPDVLASKLYEGRVGVMVDGSPFILYIPMLFTDGFQSLDDYNMPPFYASFVRILKYFSFIISVFLPGIYVAFDSFHQELIPTNLLYTIVSAEIRTPFALMFEALLMVFAYEIMREAGLRLPKPIGHAVSIIGAIVIGEASVTAGLIGEPMLVVVAVTAISSYVAYPFYESVSFLRVLFIIIGGVTGVYGLVLGGAVLFVNICSLSPYGIPFTAPISPLSKKSFGDIFYRQTWKKLSKRKVRVQDLRGVNIDEL